MSKRTFYVFKECPTKKKSKEGSSCQISVSDVPCAIPPDAKGIKTIRAKTAKEARKKYLG